MLQALGFCSSATRQASLTSSSSSSHPASPTLFDPSNYLLLRYPSSRPVPLFGLPPYLFCSTSRKIPLPLFYHLHLFSRTAPFVIFTFLHHLIDIASTARRATSRPSNSRHSCTSSLGISLVQLSTLHIICTCSPPTSPVHHEQPASAVVPPVQTLPNN